MATRDDIPQTTSKFGKIVPPFHRHGKCSLSAAIRWIDFGLPHRLGVVALFVCSFTGVGLASRAIPNAALLQETIAVSGWHGGVRLSASLGATIDGACL
ncbi:MAG: hypothetical protein VB959_19290 [Rhodospirillales bacterium]|jgi:hypothetical protein